MVLFFCNIGWTETSLPECKGSDYEKWTNCKGTETWENERKYVGEFKNDRSHGHGTYLWADGREYVGEFNITFRGIRKPRFEKARHISKKYLH